ncbi:hypothetical protein [Nostoc sp.]|uniref:hypothetical protein n=1 Tax=Nostoc sp. TaxID=1180 RepID=UPI002FFC4E76
MFRTRKFDLFARPLVFGTQKFDLFTRSLVFGTRNAKFRTAMPAAGYAYASLIYQAMSTTGYAYAFGSTFKLSITAV